MVSSYDTTPTEGRVFIDNHYLTVVGYLIFVRMPFGV